MKYDTFQFKTQVYITIWQSVLIENSRYFSFSLMIFISEIYWKYHKVTKFKKWVYFRLGRDVKITEFRFKVISLHNVLSKCPHIKVQCIMNFILRLSYVPFTENVYNKGLVPFGGSRLRNVDSKQQVYKTIPESVHLYNFKIWRLPFQDNHMQIVTEKCKK